MMRVAFWSTTFQADNQVLACHLAAQPGVDVLVAMTAPDRYETEPVNRLLPLAARVIDRDARGAEREVKSFAPDVLVVDNHLPKQRLADRLYVLWHGFGWRIDDLSRMRKELATLVGDVTRPSPNFRWHAVGDWDREYRIQHSQLAQENVLALGAPYSDLLLPDSELSSRLSRADLAQHYTIPIDRRPTVLIGLTWHHGGAFGHWGDEASLLATLCERIGAMNANVLLRMHDRHRYESAYLKLVDRVASQHAHVQVKFKSDSPDSLIDLLVSDVAVSNYSSLLNHFYYTGRPSVHIDPTPNDGRTAHYRELKWGFVRKREITDENEQWKLAPDEIGGLRARSFDELCAMIEQGLREPDCCKDKSRAFVERYITGADGSSRARAAEALLRWR